MNYQGNNNQSERLPSQEQGYVFDPRVELAARITDLEQQAYFANLHLAEMAPRPIVPVAEVYPETLETTRQQASEAVEAQPRPAAATEYHIPQQKPVFEPGSREEMLYNARLDVERAYAMQSQQAA